MWGRGASGSPPHSTKQETRVRRALVNAAHDKRGQALGARDPVARLMEIDEESAQLNHALDTLRQEHDRIKAALIECGLPDRDE